jgi:hypothetical protein
MCEWQQQGHHATGMNASLVKMRREDILLTPGAKPRATHRPGRENDRCKTADREMRTLG